MRTRSQSREQRLSNQKGRQLYSQPYSYEYPFQEEPPVEPMADTRSYGSICSKHPPRGYCRALLLDKKNQASAPAPAPAPVKSTNSSVVEPTEVETQGTCPPHLEYAFLRGRQQVARHYCLRVGIKFEEKSALIKGAKVHKRLSLGNFLTFAVLPHHGIKDSGIRNHSALKYLFCKKRICKANCYDGFSYSTNLTSKLLIPKGDENLAADHVSRLENPYENVNVLKER
ncbi:hypothetical protein Tco_0065598 [Tanacetum coccineum]